MGELLPICVRVLGPSQRSCPPPCGSHTPPRVSGQPILGEVAMSSPSVGLKWSRPRMPCPPSWMECCLLHWAPEAQLRAGPAAVSTRGSAHHGLPESALAIHSFVQRVKHSTKKEGLILSLVPNTASGREWTDGTLRCLLRSRTAGASWLRLWLRAGRFAPSRAVAMLRRVPATRFPDSREPSLGTRRHSVSCRP